MYITYNDEGSRSVAAQHTRVSERRSRAVGVAALRQPRAGDADPGPLGPQRGAHGERVHSVPGVLAGSRVVPYRQDPDEEHNRHVDPACAATVADLAARLDEHFARHEDSARSGLRVADLPIHNPHEPWRVNPADG